jgi:hypothetical protein
MITFLLLVIGRFRASPGLTKRRRLADEVQGTRERLHLLQAIQTV